MIEPSWGFSLAVSGRTMPLLVISSRSLGLMTTRSPSGRSFVAVAVALANVHSSCGGQGRPSGVESADTPAAGLGREGDVPRNLLWRHRVDPRPTLQPLPRRVGCGGSRCLALSLRECQVETSECGPGLSTRSDATGGRS